MSRNRNWNKIIVALDLGDKKKIKKVVEALRPYGIKFKIGSIAFTKFGPDLVRYFTQQKIDVFLDLKLYDIPNTMAKAATIIAELGAWAFTVHLKAGPEALKEVLTAIGKISKEKRTRRPLVLGVTELTSEASKKSKVMKLAALAKKAGLDGVIASAQEVSLIKKKFPKLKVVTPGIRSPKDKPYDQRRIATASFAFKEGADYIVIGRPLLEAKDPIKALKEI